MRNRICLSLGLCVLLAAAASAATVPAGIPRARKAATPRHSAAQPAAPAAKQPAPRADAKATGRRADAKATSPRADAKATGPRTLQDIHIEGEIPVPQVLFITARDQRRFVEFQTQRYLKTSQQVGEQTAFPSRIVVTGAPAAAPAKETAP
jgi:hypothetical protein